MIVRSLALTFFGLATAAASAQLPNLCWQRRGWPDYRYEHAMAFDANRQVVLLFGGTDGQVNFADTWGWDGRAWGTFGGATPPARAQHAMAFDALHNRVVLFGGFSSPTYYADTWEWDGVWHLRQPATVPPARRGHVLAYDYASNRIVLFGGQGNSGLLNDTWEWDGTNWVQIAGPGPSARANTAMEADGAGLVLFSGGGQTNDTWRYRNHGWQQVTPATSPPAVSGCTLTYEAASSKTLLYGGNECWEWDGAAGTWTRQSVSLPPARTGHAAAYDFVHSKLVMNGGGGRDDTWTWDGMAWAEQQLAPSARDGLAMCEADAQRTGVLLHGGFSGGNETWRWDGTGWQRLQPATPPTRGGHSLVFDPATQQPLMFGGWDGGQITATTFAWSGAVWTQLNPTVSPPAREHHAACAVNSTNHTGVLVFGGRTQGASFDNDAWLWDGTRWTPFAATASPKPPARRYAAMAQEPGLDSILLFGGGDAQGDLGDTWRLDLTNQTWTQLNLPTAPLARRGQRMVVDPARGFVLLIGGYRATDPVWAWDPTASTWNMFPAQPEAPPGLYLPGAAVGPGGQIVVFGGNSGAPNDRTWTIPGHATAMAQALGVGCGVAQGTPPALTNVGLPYLGNTMTLRVSGLPLAGTVSAVMLIDASLITLNLPQCPACTLRVVGLASVPFPVIAGSGNLALPIPCRPILRNATMHAQAVVLNPAFPCLSGLGMTNALSLTVGAY
ncbi:MAG: kelch repeat-containing protein [Planctomycetota bacterium]